MVFNQEKIAEVQRLLQASKNVVLIGHKSPDGDAVGSCLALSEFLQESHQTHVILPDSFPGFLKWMKGSQDAAIAHYNPDKVTRFIERADLIIVLDFNHPGRAGKLIEDLINNSPAPKIMIDHHRDPADFCDVMFSDIHASSTAQMVYEFIDALGQTDRISASMASAMYCGIMTDTGSFKFPSTTSRTHAIIGDLIDKGAESTRIHELVYDNNTENRLHLLGQALSGMEVYPEYQTVVIKLSQADLQKNQYQKGDTEGFVNYGLSIRGISVAVFFKEMEEIVKLSFRSQGDWYVNELARDHFNGGGHKNAAGGVSDLPLEEVLEKFRNLLPELVQYNHE